MSGETIFFEIGGNNLKLIFGEQYLPVIQLLLLSTIIGYSLLAFRSIISKNQVKDWNEIRNLDKLFLSLLVGLPVFLSSTLLFFFILLVLHMINSFALHFFPVFLIEILGQFSENVIKNILVHIVIGSFLIGSILYTSIDNIRRIEIHPNIFTELKTYLIHSMKFFVLSSIEVFILFFSYSLRELARMDPSPVIFMGGFIILIFFAINFSIYVLGKLIQRPISKLYSSWLRRVIEDNEIKKI